MWRFVPVLVLPTVLLAGADCTDGKKDGETFCGSDGMAKSDCDKLVCCWFDLSASVRQLCFGDDLALDEPALMIDPVSDVPSLREDPNITKAEKVLKAMKDVADALTKFDPEELKKLSATLFLLSGFGPHFAIAGAVVTMVNVFLPGQTTEEVRLLTELKAQLESLSNEVTEWFQKVMTQNHFDSCLTRYRDVESKITFGTKVMLDFNQDPNVTNARNLMETCGGLSCAQAAHDLLKGLLGQGGFTGCDLMQLVWTGWAGNGFHVGAVKYFQENVGYLVSLAMTGIQVHSAYISLRDNNQYAYQTVSANFKDDFTATLSRFGTMLEKAHDETIDNMKIMVDEILEDHGDNLNNQDLNKMVGSQIDANWPNKLWGVVTYDVLDDDETWYHCSGGDVTKWIDQNGHNMVIMGVDSAGVVMRLGTSLYLNAAERQITWSTLPGCDRGQKWSNDYASLKAWANVAYAPSYYDVWVWFSNEDGTYFFSNTSANNPDVGEEYGTNVNLIYEKGVPLIDCGYQRGYNNCPPYPETCFGGADDSCDDVEKMLNSRAGAGVDFDKCWCMSDTPGGKVDTSAKGVQYRLVKGELVAADK